MMTTAAALLGGVPLALGTGTGSELRRPLGITIIGGLLFSQALTLYTTPVIYVAFDKLARRFRRSPEPARADVPVEPAGGRVAGPGDVQDVELYRLNDLAEPRPRCLVAHGDSRLAGVIDLS